MSSLKNINPKKSKSNVLADEGLKKRISGLYKYMSKRLGIKGAPKIYLSHSNSNAKKPFGLTGFYNPNQKSIRIFTTNRHPTDILRSFAHEIIHHWQNERGKLNPSKEFNEGYAQNDPNLRRRELEAYMIGNILFRDYQDLNRKMEKSNVKQNS
jgi:hypothetical protein